MDDKIITTFCLCDDLLKAIHHQEDCQCQMNDAEIMTTALVRPNQRLAVDTFLGLKKSKLFFRTRVALHFQ